MPFVFDFDHTHRKPPMEMKDLLGGKGANLAEMTSVLELPVPPGFTIATTACRAYMEGGWPDGLTDEVAKARARLEKKMGKRIGDPSDPLLVSVRSGAKFSMPGMMDTVLNLGPQRPVGRGPGQADRRRAVRLRLLPAVRGHVRAHRARTSPARSSTPSSTRPRSWPAPRRTPGSPSSCCATWSTPTSRSSSATPASPSPRIPTSSCAGPSRRCSPRGTGRGPSPTGSGSGSPTTSAPRSTCRPWCSATATTTRGPASASPVTRPPVPPASTATSWSTPRARTWWPASGTPSRSSALKDRFPAIHKELLAIFARLEAHYRDMCDTEFTIEQGKLWMLQTRVGKRTGRAALRMAVDMVGERAIKLTKEEARASGSPATTSTRSSTRSSPGRATPCWPGASAPPRARRWAGST